MVFHHNISRIWNTYWIWAHYYHMTKSVDSMYKSVALRSALVWSMQHWHPSLILHGGFCSNQMFRRLKIWLFTSYLAKEDPLGSGFGMIVVVTNQPMLPKCLETFFCEEGYHSVFLSTIVTTVNSSEELKRIDGIMMHGFVHRCIKNVRDFYSVYCLIWGFLRSIATLCIAAPITFRW